MKNMYKVKTLNNIKSSALDVLGGEKYTVSGDIEDPNAIIVRSAKLHEMEFNPELLCIARAGAGVNNIPIDRCADEGIVVFNTPGANSDGVKELAICALFLSSRDIVDGVNWVKTIASEGDNVAPLVEKGKAQFGGPEIGGKTLGVIGLGAIGAKIAGDASLLGMKVYGYDPYLSVEAAWHLRPEIIRASDIDTIYKNSDYITINVPYMKATHNFINKESIAKMKPGVRIINLARAELVCDDDMLEALASGQVSRYVTDFPNGKTAGAAGVISIPHLGASTPESEENCVSMACSEIIDYIENGNIVNSVNMPNAYIPRSGNPRLCVIHKNDHEIAAKITSTASSSGASIANALTAANEGRKNAYTILDVDKIPEGLEAAISKVEGVIKVRAIS